MKHKWYLTEHHWTSPEQQHRGTTTHFENPKISLYFLVLICSCNEMMVSFLDCFVHFKLQWPLMSSSFLLCSVCKLLRPHIIFHQLLYIILALIHCHAILQNDLFFNAAFHLMDSYFARNTVFEKAVIMGWKKDLTAEQKRAIVRNLGDVKSML